MLVWTLLLPLLLTVGFLACHAYLRYRRPRHVACPEVDAQPLVRADALHAALTAVAGCPDVRVASCELWPEAQGCGQRCVAQL